MSRLSTESERVDMETAKSLAWQLSATTTRKINTAIRNSRGCVFYSSFY